MRSLVEEKKKTVPTAMKHDNTLVTDEVNIANILNDFIVNVGPAINVSVIPNDTDPLSHEIQYVFHQQTVLKY